MILNELWLDFDRRRCQKKDPYLDIVDLKGLCTLKSYYKPYMGPYGIGRAILRYMGYSDKKRLTCPIEHGVQLQDSFVTQEEVAGASEAVVTYSRFRKDVIERLSEKKGISIGSFISYVDDYKTNEEFNEIKRKLGRTLLVYSAHSIPGLHFYYDIDSYIREIERISINFDSVIISVHYYDHIIGLDKEFMKKGFLLVSAGNANSPFFLSRVKLILQLSDAVISNGFTSALSYALCLFKPVYIYNQCYSVNQYDFNNFQCLDYKQKKEFYDICQSSVFDNLEEQRRWGDYYFGLNVKYSPEHLRSILKKYVRDDGRILKK